MGGRGAASYLVKSIINWGRQGGWKTGECRVGEREQRIVHKQLINQLVGARWKNGIGMRC